MLKVCIVGLLLISLVGCSSENYDKTITEKSNKGTLINIKKSSDLLDMVSDKADSKAKYIYFGRPTCEFCQAFQGELQKVLDNVDEPVYYYNTDTFREDRSFQKVVETFDIQVVPFLVKVENGAVIDSMTNDKDVMEFIE